MKIEIVCQQQQWQRNGLDLYVIARSHEGNVSYVGLPVTMQEIKESSASTIVPQGPTVFLDWNAAQSLMDAMYAAGVRPSEARHVNDTVAAVKEHIADLRKVAFGLLDHMTAEPELVQAPREPTLNGSGYDR